MENKTYCLCIKAVGEHGYNMRPSRLTGAFVLFTPPLSSSAWQSGP